MSKSALLGMFAGIVIIWFSFWIYMLCSVLSDDLEKIKKQIIKLESEFTRLQDRQSAERLNKKSGTPDDHKKDCDVYTKERSTK